MVLPEIGTLVVFFLGVLVGGIIFSPTFRVKFFKGLRKFLTGLGQGARNYSARQQGSKIRTRTEQDYHPEVKHRYTQTHHLINCENCDGSGRIPRKLPPMVDASLIKNKTDECPDCEGTGKVYD